ncbi:hypothetical protein AURANDRAFT_68590, partial [Aureococcus anophagefferens]
FDLAVPWGADGEGGAVSLELVRVAGDGTRTSVGAAALAGSAAALAAAPGVGEATLGDARVEYHVAVTSFADAADLAVADRRALDAAIDGLEARPNLAHRVVGALDLLRDAAEDPPALDVGPEHVRPTGLNDAPLAAEVAPAYEAAGWEKSPKSDAVAPSDDWEDGAPLEKRPCCGACDDNPRCQACCAKGKHDVKQAHADYDNMSWVEWVDYAEDLSDSVGEFADAIVALEDSMNEVTADMGISNYQQETACDGGDASGYLDGVDSTGTLCDDYEEADRYINFARKARSASDSVGDVSDCLRRLYGVDDDATFPPTTVTPYPTSLPTAAPSDQPTTAYPTATPTTGAPSAVPTSFPTWVRGNLTGHRANFSDDDNYYSSDRMDPPPCMDNDEYDALQAMAKNYKNTAKLFKGIVQLIDMVAHMLMDVNVDLVILVYVGLMLLHGLMLLFILYVVYCPGLGVNEFIYYLYDESYKRVMPKRYERRCRELADAANAAFADTAGARASKNYNMAYKMARKSVVYGYNQAAESACDVHYVVRFWLIYLFIDVLLFVCGLLIFFHFVIIALGNKATCRAVFDLLPGIKASLRIFKETAEKSCFFELSDSAYGTHRWYASEIEEDCDVEIQSALIKAMRGDRGDAAIITIATILLCVGHWCLIHWLPAAMAYAKPESLRAHLEDLIVNNEDAELAPLVSRAKSEMMLADVPPPGDDDAAPAADGDAPEEKAPDAADDEPTADLPPPRLLVDLPPSPEAGVVDLPPPPPPAERDDVEATTLSPGATKHLIDQPGVGVDCCGVGSQDMMEDPPAQPQVKML